MVLNLADPGYLRMVVEDFGRDEMKFTREQHAHDKGAHPIFVPIIPHGSQFDRRLFRSLRLNLWLCSLKLYNTKQTAP